MNTYYYDVTKEDVENVVKQYPYLKNLGDDDDILKTAKKNMDILLKKEYPLYAISLKISRTTVSNMITAEIPDYKEDNKIDKHEVYKFLSDKFKETKRDIDNESDIPIGKEQAIFQKAFGSASYIRVIRVPATEKKMNLYNKLVLEMETEHIKPNRVKPKL